VTHLRIARTLLLSATVVAGFASSALAETAKPANVNVAASQRPASPAQPSKSNAPASGTPTATKPNDTKGPDLASLKQSIVVIEQSKRPVAMGIVLGGDGRILTALTPIGMGNSLSARYASGDTKRLRVAASHRGMNLALLSPEDSRYTHGLRASRLAADDPTAHTRWLRSNQAGAGQLVATGVLRRETLTGGDDYTLRDVFTVGVVPRPLELGTALVDESGDVVGLISQACQTQPNGDCRSVAYVIPVAMIKEFLRAVPAGAVSPAPWIGLRVIEAETCAIKALRIVAVDAKGPLAALGLRPGKDAGSADLLVAIDGIALGSSRAFDEILHRHKVGDRVRLLILGDGRYREVAAVLGSEPERQPGASAMLSQDVGY
jgi:serine protease Do